MEQINSAKKFDEKIKKVKKDQLLIFHGNNSNPARVNQYYIVALRAADKRPIEIYSVNIDSVNLTNGDASKYTDGKNVICCTTVNDGVVMEKMVNPFETTLKQMVHNILV